MSRPEITARIRLGRVRIAAFWTLAMLTIGQGGVAWAGFPACYDRAVQDARATEALLEGRVETHPDDAEAWRHFARWLAMQQTRERLTAAYHVRLDWQTQDAMAPDFLERSAARQREVIEGWVAARPDDPEAWCALARSEPDLESRVAITTAATESLPASFEVARCHIDALVDRARAREALTFARSFRDRNDQDPDAHLQLLHLSERMRRNVGAPRRALARQIDAARAESIVQMGLAAPALDHLTEDYERYARSIDSVAAHLALADHEAEIGRAGRAAGRLEALAARSLDATERAELCRGVDTHRGLFPASSLESCWRRVVFSRGNEALGQANRAAIEAANEELFSLVFDAADWHQVDAILRPLEPATRTRFWADQWFDDAASCEKLRQDVSSGWLGVGNGFEQRTSVAGFESMFRRCGMADEADVWSARLGALRAEAARFTGSAIIITPTPEHADFYRRHAARRPDDARPLEALFTIARQIGDVDAALSLADDALGRGPRGLDLSLRIAAYALDAAPDDASPEDAAPEDAVLAIADRVDDIVEASPRQRAESAYLRARVARRRGDLDAASRGFDDYFSLRHRFEGCCGVAACDRGYLLHLVEAGDFERLASYRARRQAALDAFTTAVEPLDALGRANNGTGTCASQEIPSTIEAVLDAGCVPAATVRALEARVAATPTDAKLSLRLDDLRARPICDQVLDPESSFPDLQLFELSSVARCGA